MKGENQEMPSYEEIKQLLNEISVSGNNDFMEPEDSPVNDIDEIKDILKDIPSSEENIKVTKQKIIEERDKLINKRLAEFIKGLIQDREQRKDFSTKIYRFASVYMYLVFFILILTGCQNSFKLSDTVLITLLGTTTANVIGLLIIVVKYLFNNKK